MACVAPDEQRQQVQGTEQRAEVEPLRRGSGRAGEGLTRTCADPLRGRIKVLQATAAAHDATPSRISP